MSLTIELEPETEARLAELARAKGLPVNEFARAVLEREAAPKPARRLSELRGLGAEIWRDIGDAQEWVSKERSEWDHRP